MCAGSSGLGGTHEVGGKRRRKTSDPRRDGVRGCKRNSATGSPFHGVAEFNGPELVGRIRSATQGPVLRHEDLRQWHRRSPQPCSRIRKESFGRPRPINFGPLPVSSPEASPSVAPQRQAGRNAPDNPCWAIRALPHILRTPRIRPTKPADYAAGRLSVHASEKSEQEIDNVHREGGATVEHLGTRQEREPIAARRADESSSSIGGLRCRRAMAPNTHAHTWAARPRSARTDLASSSASLAREAQGVARI